MIHLKEILRTRKAKITTGIIAGSIVMVGIIIAIFLLQPAETPTLGDTEPAAPPRYTTVDNICPYIDIKPLVGIVNKVKSTEPSKVDSLGIIRCRLTLNVTKSPDGTARQESTKYLLTVHVSFAENETEESIAKRKSMWQAISKRSDQATARSSKISTFTPIDNLGDDAYSILKNFGVLPTFDGQAEFGTLSYKESVLSQNMHVDVELTGAIQEKTVDGKEFNDYVHTILTDIMQKLKKN